MCGICGIVSLGQPAASLAADVQRMLVTLVHRGPDDQGIFELPGIALGARRLAIQDPERGRQPAANEDGTVWALLNGEIYNSPELRRQLEKTGHRILSRCDTELIPHLYEELGEALLDAIDGMFSIALWDGPSRSLLLARDRLGIKPLYYALHGDRFLFGSEIKAILAALPATPQLDPAALSDYLAYLYVPGERTFFRGIRRLLPGRRLLVRDGQVEERRYWSLRPRSAERGTLREHAGRLRLLLRRAVERRLLSDVPLGLFLSGGLDSSAIAASMVELLGPRRVETFTIAFDGGGLYDEHRAAARVARHLGTRHHVFRADIDLVTLLPALTWHMDEPVANTSALPLYLLSREARHYVTVALVGTGGDEVLGGYRRYAGEYITRNYLRIPGLLRRKFIEPLVGLLPASRTNLLLDTFRLAKKFLAGIADTEAARYAAWMTFFTHTMKLRLLAPPMLEEIGASLNTRVIERAYEEATSSTLLDKLMITDLRTYLVDDLLNMGDRMTMAASLESRFPFLDRELVEAATTIPDHMRLQGLKGKLVLREAMKGVLPAETTRRRKHGFTVPTDRWLRHHLRPLMQHLLHPRRLAEKGIFRPEGVQALMEEHLSGREERSLHLFALMAFEVWHQIFMERRDPQQVSEELSRIVHEPQRR